MRPKNHPRSTRARSSTDPGDEFADQSGPRAVLASSAALTVRHGAQRVRERRVLGERFQQVDQVAAVVRPLLVTWIGVGRRVVVAWR